MSLNRFVRKSGDDGLSGADRRRHRRIPSQQLPIQASVRIRHRESISLVDLSSSGALIELPFPVRPDARLTLELQTPADQLIVPFQLLRCYVTDLKNGVRYHAAGAFERAIAMSLLGGRSALPGDLLLKELDTFRRTHEAGAYFNELLDFTVVQLQGGETASATEARIVAHLRRRFPSLVSGPAIGLTITGQLGSADRRFLQACSQLISLLRVPSFSSGEAVTRVHSPAHFEVVHNIADWMEERV